MSYLSLSLSLSHECMLKDTTHQHRGKLGCNVKALGLGIPKIRGGGQGDNLVGLHILRMRSTVGFIHCKARGKGYYKLEHM
jgi:hypothetical protein